MKNYVSYNSCFVGSDVLRPVCDQVVGELIPVSSDVRISLISRGLRIIIVLIITNLYFFCRFVSRIRQHYFLMAQVSYVGSSTKFLRH